MKSSNSISKNRFCGLLGLLIGFCSFTAAHAQVSLNYLGDLGGDFSEAYGINDAGQVVGLSATSPSQPEQAVDTDAFLYTPGIGMQDLGNLGAPYSQAYAVSNSSEVVGSSITNTTYDTSQAFTYTSESGMQPLSGVGQTYAAGYGVNSSGQIAGSYNNSSYITRAFIYTPGSGMQDIGPAVGSSNATGMNDSGQVVGSETTAGNVTTAFVYSSSTGLVSLGVLPGYVSSGATAINNKGQVVGSLSEGGYSSVPFIYSSATGMQVLGSIEFASATAINNFGVVVGNYDTVPPETGQMPSAFIYTLEGGVQDLNVLYSSLLVSGTGTETGFTKILEANGINDAGQIVGEGLYYNGTTSYQAAFILDTAPEPSTWALLLSGLGLLAVWRFHTRRPLV